MRNQLEFSDCENPDDVEVYFYIVEKDSRNLMFLVDAEIEADRSRKEGFFIDMAWVHEGEPIPVGESRNISVGRGRFDP